MKTMDLNGSWQLHWSTGQRGGSPYAYRHTDESENNNEYRGEPRHLAGEYPGGWLTGTVPGEVHLDLMKAGLLEDPRVGINVFKARWVEETVWYYRRTFDAPAEALSGRVYLHFEELDLSAIVYLNGVEIARHENAFYPLCVPLTGKLLPTGNELVVRVDSGLFNVSDKPVRGETTATGDVGVLLTKRMWLRKPQYETEWDWSPRLMNVGISGSVQLTYDPSLVVEQWQLRQQVSEDLGEAALTARLFPADGFDPTAVYTLEMTVDGKTYTAEGTGDKLTVTGTVTAPKLWYPVGYGEQALYSVSLRLLHSGETVWEKETETGFRRVEVKQPPHPEKGHYFIIDINGTPVFFKGGNFVPASLFPAAVTAEDYDRITDRALEANFNMLRIWGGGLYERDALYRICNRKGILLWQEFISACAYPPCEKDETLYQSMLTEARYQVRRLSVHPSLVVWCGNNELSPWGHAIYMEDYPAIIREEDPEKYYQPASPYTDNALENAPDGNGWWEFAGDQHPWDVGFMDKDHRKYRKMQCRFPNEGGILGPTNRRAFAQITDGTGDYTHSMAYECHDNMLAYMRPGTSPDEDLKFWLGFSPAALKLDSYIAAGGYVQGEGLADYIDNFRRRAFSSSSAIFWMFNDCWPCSRSWTIIDDAARRNLSFHQVKNAFAPVRLVLTEEEDGSATVWGVNDSGADCSGILTAGLFLSDSAVQRSETLEVTLPARSVTRLTAVTGAVMPLEVTGSLPIAFAMLCDADGKLITRNRLLTHRYFEYALCEPRITVTKNGDETTFVSDRYVMGVCLDIDGEDALSDNLFDLYPGIPHTVRTVGHDTVLYTIFEALYEGSDT